MFINGIEVSEEEKKVFEEFEFDERWCIDFDDASIEERYASCYAVSDEIKSMDNWDVLDEMERKEWLYCNDDDWYRLTAAGLDIYMAIAGA